MELSGELLVLLFFVAMLAGFIDTLAGGGGLITIPVLLLSGFPPVAALATNKLQGCVGSGSATLLLIRHGRLDFTRQRRHVVYAFSGAIVGTILIQFIAPDLLKSVIPIVLIAIASYFLFSALHNQKPTKERMSDRCYRSLVIPIIGFYDGMFGPGTGSFFSFSGVFFRGFGIIHATANAKLLNFSTNLASLLVFIVFGEVVWFAGMLMAIGQIFGAWIGAHILLKINPLYLKMLVVVVCLIMLGKYFIQ